MAPINGRASLGKDGGWAVRGSVNGTAILGQKMGGKLEEQMMTMLLGGLELTRPFWSR